MKKRIFAFFMSVCSLFCIFVTATACDNNKTPEKIDYAAQAVLDLNGKETLKQEVTVNMFIDGDTTHFNVPKTIVDRGILKARYLAVNTPESTGKIEEWGKKASAYTRSHLEQKDVSIILETDGDEWAKDSTGERYLVWVWYKTPEMSTYRNLNLELLQEGLAVGSKASATRYGKLAVAAINQAIVLKLHVHSSETDPDFYYGASRTVELKELSLNTADYLGQRVSFEGVVSQYYNQGVFVEEYDAETDMYYGIYVYYGFFLGNEGKSQLLPGNRVHVAGVVSYWESAGTYQVSDLTYDEWDLDNPENIQLISEDNPVAYPETSAAKFLSNVNVTVTKDGEEVTEQRLYARVGMHTSLSMKNLLVKKAYTTANDGNNDGAMTLTCEVDGKTITIRTTKLYNADFSLITQDKYLNKTIDVKGVIDVYNGEYQIKVFDAKDITVH